MWKYTETEWQIITSQHVGSNNMCHDEHKKVILSLRIACFIAKASLTNINNPQVLLYSMTSNSNHNLRMLLRRKLYIAFTVVGGSDHLVKQKYNIFLKLDLWYSVVWRCWYNIAKIKNIIIILFSYYIYAVFMGWTEVGIL